MGAFFRWFEASKVLALGAAEKTLFEKIPGGIFELNMTQTNHEARNTQTSKLHPKNWQDTACRIELADVGLNFHRAKSVLPPAY